MDPKNARSREIGLNILTMLILGVENKNVSVTKYETHPYTTENSKSITYIVPIKDLRFLYITFPIPDLDPFYKSSPGDYLAHLVPALQTLSSSLTLRTSKLVFVVPDNRLL
jgi:secreted Zn-dependent insulinase-like peptidase